MMGGIRIRVFLIGLCLVSLAACHQAKPDGPSSPIEQLRQPEHQMAHYTLSNGLEVLVVERHLVPTVTILSAVKNGALAESPEYDGLSHLYEHMFFKGNAVMPNQEAYMRRVRELGMSFNGTTSTEAVQYFFTLPKENLDAGLEFMRDALVGPVFDETELKREISTVLGEYDRSESDPRHFLGEAMTKALFSAFPSRKNVLGEREAIISASREKMLTIKHRYYVPNNTLLIVAGDVDSKKVLPLIRKYYLSWPKAPNPFDLHPVPDHPPLEKTKTLKVAKPFQNVLFQFSWHGPSIDKDRQATYAADVHSFILSQRASKFTLNLIDSGKLNWVGLGYYTQRHIGPINFYGQASPERAREALATMKKEISRLNQPDYFSDEELENAKLQLAVEDIYAWQRGLNIARSLGFWWCVSDIEYRNTYVENLKAVTREDIKRYLERYIIDKPYVLGILSSPENMAGLAPEDGGTVGEGRRK